MTFFFEIYGFLYSAIMELKYYSVLENRIVNFEEQFLKNENMTSEQRQNIWGFR